VYGQLDAPVTLPPGKEPGSHWIGGWVVPRAILAAVKKNVSLAPPGNLIQI
jgi:hypothetical protein